MAFFQSIAVRLGTQKFLEWVGIDPATAGWVGSGTSLLTAILTADPHGHFMSELMARDMLHPTVAHGASQLASHTVAHGTSQLASHTVAHGTSQLASHTVTHGWRC
ncbi:hypothetical protein [Nostoc sp. WHI]|uniref:hypothetical protein n=1 Tax=Nostoc sp. WHI TaxID=2650611 RepID=UPI0018C4FA79|nr:hypothetical protein [Nostoc sp. WHI]MBG1265467.1 hypothetical protein [Nostoc sp. WHI]MBG1265490.1 hypothetical protein [Nostoc sp. WHI]